jgi:hypothetical protein
MSRWILATNILPSISNLSINLCLSKTKTCQCCCYYFLSDSTCKSGICFLCMPINSDKLLWFVLSNLSPSVRRLFITEGEMHVNPAAEKKIPKVGKTFYSCFQRIEGRWNNIEKLNFSFLREWLLRIEKLEE